MKGLYKRAIAYLFCICLVIAGMMYYPTVSLAAEKTDIIVEINVKQNGEDIDIQNKTFYVALFSDADFTKLAEGPNSVVLKQSHSNSTTFSVTEGTYYVAQTDAEGAYLEEEGVSVTCSKLDGKVTVKEGDESVTVVMTRDYTYNPNQEATASTSSAVATTRVSTVTTVATVTSAASTSAVTTTTRATTASTARTTTSTSTTSTATSTSKLTTSAKTADENQIGFYSIVALLCMTAAGWIVYERKKSI